MNFTMGNSTNLALGIASVLSIGTLTLLGGTEGFVGSLLGYALGVGISLVLDK